MRFGELYSVCNNLNLECTVRILEEGKTPITDVMRNVFREIIRRFSVEDGVVIIKLKREE